MTAKKAKSSHCSLTSHSYVCMYVLMYVSKNTVIYRMTIFNNLLPTRNIYIFYEKFSLALINRQKSYSIDYYD